MFLVDMRLGLVAEQRVEQKRNIFQCDFHESHQSETVGFVETNVETNDETTDSDKFLS